MVAVMDPNLEPSSVYHFIAVDTESSLWNSGPSSVPSVSDNCSVNMNSMCREAAMVRSVAMSANVASIVKDEMRHLIRVSASETDAQTNLNSPKVNSEDGPDVLTINNEHNVNISSVQSSCSHILPAVEGSIICGVILSRWDDIMGPQTVHAWLNENQMSRSTSDTSSSSISMGSTSEMKNSTYVPCNHQLPEQNLYLTKAVKYVTSHTVNYTGLCLNASTSSLFEQESNLFVVPDLGLVAQSLVFHARSLVATVPFSLAILVEYQHYEYFLHLRQLCHQWLRRMAERLQEPLLKCMSTGTGFTTVGLSQLNNWVLELWHTVFSLGTCGLGKSLPACGADMLNHPLLERALTSHLQTFGCSVVMGTSSSDINALISFLALFLDTDERFCSRLVLPSMKYSYHVGLFVQGLLLDEFGCREMCSVDLAANPYLVTAVDLTKGVNPNAVRQTAAHQLSRRSGDAKALLHSILCPVKESASLVRSLLKDMRHVPPCSWQEFINLFKTKVSSLAHVLLSFTHHSGGDGKQGMGSLQRQMTKSMNLSQGDFLIVLAAADKLKPGIYDYIMELGR